MPTNAISVISIAAALALAGCQLPHAKPAQAPEIEVPAPSSAPAAPPANAPAAPALTVTRPAPKSPSPAASRGTAKQPAAPPVAATTKPAVAAPKSPPLDLNSLEQRLKDTKAIGVFTKLSLKNQVDDLLSELRAYHQGSGKTPPSELRQKYDLLMIKVLSLLQDGDPQLASAIASSREAIWSILMDPQKFSRI